MPAFFLSLMAALILSAGGRDQRLMAALSARTNGALPLLGIAGLSASVAAGVAAIGGMLVAPLLSASAKSMLLAMTLAVAALELAWDRKQQTPTEPTQSVFAIMLVIVSRQVTDGARFVLFGLVASTGSFWMVFLGGTLGGAAALTVAWATSDGYVNLLPWRTIRYLLSAVCLVFAGWQAITALGVV